MTSGALHRRWFVGCAAVGTGAMATGLWTLSHRPAADAPPWWPAALCLADADVMTPAKVKRAERRRRGKLRGQTTVEDAP